MEVDSCKSQIADVQIVFSKPNVQKKSAASCSKPVKSSCAKKVSARASCSKTASKPNPYKTSCSKPAANPSKASCSKSASKPNPSKTSCSKPAADPCKTSCSKPAEAPCESDSDAKITRNPFFNFLRDFRVCHQDESSKEIAVNGGKQWNTMSEKDKSKYIIQAFRTPKKYNRSKMNLPMEE